MPAPTPWGEKIDGCQFDHSTGPWGKAKRRVAHDRLNRVFSGNVAQFEGRRPLGEEIGELEPLVKELDGPGLTDFVGKMRTEGRARGKPTRLSCVVVCPRREEPSAGQAHAAITCGGAVARGTKRGARSRGCHVWWCVRGDRNRARGKPTRLSLWSRGVLKDVGYSRHSGEMNQRASPSTTDVSTCRSGIDQ